MQKKDTKCSQNKKNLSKFFKKKFKTQQKKLK